MSERITPKDVTTCAGSALYLLVVAPMWLYLLYQILARVNSTTAMWVAYWVYLPSFLVVGIFGAFAKLLEGKDD